MTVLLPGDQVTIRWDPEDSKWYIAELDYFGNVDKVVRGQEKALRGLLHKRLSSNIS